MIAFGAVLAGAAGAASADPHHPGDRGPRGPQRPIANVQIAAIQYDSPGRDTGTNASRNAEWISLVNNGRRAVNLRGYTISDRANHVYRFGNVWIQGDGGRLVVHTGFGQDEGRQLFWDSRSYIWNNNGDTATLSGPRGRTLDSCTYRERAGRSRVIC
ncbi:lamin tail domain-containing protein [Asanoa sp. WMMD1127]|uniref:lamin tail domain-containing protein n=1 Tax=Asanoa sp. WMMD1127 TaxID=3016107 RepID=UPI002415FF68|nr:lamin tail domain-containing protein [Asanoa sp. WMMD1127]MDG4825768.1 lamin tail domain-containing protein [Asanoa sp. WMMD1127]